MSEAEGGSAIAAGRPRRLRKLWWVLTGLIACAALLAALLPAILSTGLAKGLLTSAASRSAGAPIDWSSASFSWLGKQRIEGLRVGPADGFPPDEDLIAVEAVEVPSGLWSVLFGDAIDVELVKPAVNARRSRDGVLNIVKALLPPNGEHEGPDRPREERGGGGKAPGTKDERRPARSVHVAIREAAVRFRDEGTDLAVDLTSANGQVEVAAGGLRAELKTGVASSAGQPPGEATLAATLSSAKEWTVEASARGIDPGAWKAPLEKLARAAPPDGPISLDLAGEGTAGAAHAVLSFEAADGRGASRGRVEARAALVEGGDVSVACECGVSLQAVVAWLPRLAPEGLEVSSKSMVKVTGLSLAGKLGADATPGIASLSGGGRVELEGAVKWKGSSLDGASARLVIEGGEARVEGLRARVNGGDVLAERVSVDLKAAPVQYDVALQLEGVGVTYEMTEALAYVVPFLALDEREATFLGKMRGELTLEGRGLTREEMEKSWKGRGSLRVTDGQVSASKALREVAELAGADLRSVLFSELGSDFTIGEGRFDVAKCYIQGKAGSKVRNLGLKGFTRFDRSIEFGVDLGQLEETVGDKKLKGILRGAVKVLGDGLFPLKLAGTLSEPRIALDPRLEKGSALDPKSLPVDDILDLFKKKKKEKEKTK